MSIRPLLAIALACTAACRPTTLTPAPAPSALTPVADTSAADTSAADVAPRRVPSNQPCAIVPSDEEMRRAAWAGYRIAFTALVDSLTGDPRFRSAHWGVLVVDPHTGDTIVSRNAGKLFMPPPIRSSSPAPSRSRSSAPTTASRRASSALDAW